MAYQFNPPKTKVSTVAALVGGNRLEPRPRSAEFNRSLRAEVRDAAWLLTRQWQLKEFRAEDRGSPVAAQAAVEYARLNQVQLNDGTPHRFDEPLLPTPWDALVEAQAPLVDTGLQLQMAHYWQRLLRRSALTPDHQAAVQAFCRTTFPLPVAGAGDAGSGTLAAAGRDRTQAEAFQLRQVLGVRAVAGYDLYDWLRQRSPEEFLQASGGDTFADLEKESLLEALQQFTAWYERLYTQPVGGAATGGWSVPDMAYRFAAAAPSSTGKPVVVAAREHPGGQLDWYTTDEVASPGAFANTSGVVQQQRLTFVPTEIQFAGAPNARWWEFEDRKVDFGQVTADPSDFGRMLLQEFMFLYHNDWFNVPFTVPAGTVCTVTELQVTDVFGQRYRIQPAGDGALQEADGTAIDQDWGRWSVYALSQPGNRTSSVPRLLLPPTAVGTQQGRPVEQVYLAREEATNLVWGVEQVVPDGMGRGMDGNAAAARVAEYLRSKATPVTSLAAGALLDYRLATSVAENWIPFVPRLATAQYYELEQGQMQRHVEGLALTGDDTIVEPRTALLGIPVAPPYLIHERQVPPTGVRLEGAFRRARWFDGKPVLWYGRRRNVGRVGGSSGLAYDQLLARAERTEPVHFELAAAATTGTSPRLTRARLYALTDAGARVADAPVLELTRPQLLELLERGDTVGVAGTTSGSLDEVIRVTVSGQPYLQRVPVADPAPAQDVLGNVAVLP